MELTAFLGVLVVAAGGLLMGSGAWPFKLMRKYQFEHWWFIGMLVGLVIMPWAITLLGCPNAIEGLRGIPRNALIAANIFSVGWGIANVLCGICYVRIGVALTGAILAGLGVSVGAITPMIFKGSGRFSSAPDVTSPAGLTVLTGVAVVLVGVVIASLAGFGRDRAMQKNQQTSGGFLGGLIMTVIAGVLSSFMAFVFVYGQGPIVANVSVIGSQGSIKVTVDNAKDLTGEYPVAQDGSIEIPRLGSIQVAGLRAVAAADLIRQQIITTKVSSNPDVTVETGSIPATFAVFAVGLIGGVIVNLGYAVYLLTKNRSWNVFFQTPGELALAIIIGIDFSIAVALMGKGMLLLGALGGSVGFGIQQAMQMSGTQALGFISGEWRGVLGKPRYQMYLAIAILIVAAVIMAYGNTLAKG